MSPDWSFNLLEFPHLVTQPLSRIKSSSANGSPASTSQQQIGGSASPPRRTSVEQPAVSYERLHLLGLPGEIRVAIWRSIHYDVLLGSEELWFQHPSTAWDALQLTCRQINIEIAEFWPCTILPSSKGRQRFRSSHKSRATCTLPPPLT